MKRKYLLILLSIIAILVIIGITIYENYYKIDYDYEIIEDATKKLDEEGVEGSEIEVVVHDELGIEELEKLSKGIVRNKRRKMGKFNGLIINFYDSKEYVGFGDTLGHSVFASEGNMLSAKNVDPGKYREMTFGFHLKEKDWTKKLSQEENEIYEKWNEVFLNESKNKDSLDEDLIAKEVSSELGKTEEEVWEVIYKFGEWNLNDLNDEETLNRGGDIKG